MWSVQISIPKKKSAVDPFRIGALAVLYVWMASLFGLAQTASPSADWLRHGRMLPGETPAALRYRAYLRKLEMRKQRELRGTAITPSDSTDFLWAPLGPSPLASDATGSGQQDYNWVSGRATAVAVDPSDITANTIYVGGAYGGVWKSANAGSLSADPASVQWTPVADDQATLAVGSIAIQPGNTDPARSLVLVGTGEADSSFDSYYGLGILRSTDAGSTWTLITSDLTGTRSFAGLAFSKIAFSTSTASIAVAAAAGASEGILEGLENPLSVNRGLYVSADSGASWSYANVQDGGTQIDPASATSVIYHSVAGDFFAALRYHGFYSSSDGINWTRLSNQPGAGLSSSNCPPQVTTPNLCPIYRGELAALRDPNDPSRSELYAWYVDAYDNDQGIWESTNGGTTWTELDDTGITECGDQTGCGTQQGSYNLTLAAVPNGQATDLYAGAVNLYKCTITSVFPTCSPNGSPPPPADMTFQNLTHAYGCAPDFGSLAHVHPSQHAIAFPYPLVNGKELMFFANDGGIYRSLDGYTGLTTGDCSGSNQFDSLNQTLGSMTQFVSFAQSTSDPDILLGGAEGNGSPATNLALISSSWLNVNSGDGGNTQIDPSNDNQWFVSAPPDAISGVNVYACASGINCHSQDFSNDQVVNSAVLGGDTGPYYPPFILDPRNSSQLIVGTCRVWRGAASGGSFTLLSQDFETGGDGICTGAEVNLVRSLAAGGPPDASGLSTVIYAGTDGYGPLVPSSPAGGHVWVSTNAASGTQSWIDRTGIINPDNFPVSSIAVDPSDGTGLTAYLAIMGFHVSHIWKTTNGGVSWIDFTANLPDAPVNAVLIDPGATSTTGTVYAGTDVGVFSSSTGSASWMETGPAPGPSAQGFLPNVAVTSLGMFNTPTTKILRASTYGRGIWQFPLITIPDFVLHVSNTPLTIFGGESGVFSGTAFALNGYDSLVSLSCASGTGAMPPTCVLAPSTLTPSSSGTSFTVTASGLDGDYSFNLHGADSQKLIHDVSLTLHVVDFALTPPSPASLTVAPSSSASASFQVTAAGAFAAAVSLSCTGLPAGATCNFQPSSTINPTSKNPIKVTLSIAAALDATPGNFPITIAGATPGGPTEKQDLALVISGSGPGYALAISNSSQTASVTGLATFQGTLTAVGSYNYSVRLSCGSGAPPSCTPVPASLTPTSSGATFTVTAKSSEVKTYNFNITGAGSDPESITHSSAVTFAATFDFSLTATSGLQSIAAGQTATYDLDAKPEGSNFPSAVDLSCSGLPQEATCAFSPSQVTTNSGDTPITLNIATKAPLLAHVTPARRSILGLFALCLPLSGLLLVMNASQQRPRRRRFLCLVAIAFLLVAELACGLSSGGNGNSNGTSGTPPGTYQVTITAVSGSLTRTTPVTLTVN